MPILKNAIAKLKLDKKRAELNKGVRTVAKSAVKLARKSVSKESLGKAYSALDRAAKKGVFHKRKADRLKSRLSKLLK